jgi:hypothetical protein
LETGPDPMAGFAPQQQQPPPVRQKRNPANRQNLPPTL